MNLIAPSLKADHSQNGGLFQRFRRNTRGVSAVEFALIVPSMLTLFFGTLEASELMTVKRRMTVAVNQLADLVSQSRDENDLANISQEDLDILITNVTNSLQTDNLSGTVVNVYSLVRDPDGGDKSIVHWSRNKKGENAKEPGAKHGAVRARSIPEGTSLIYAEVNYTYKLTVTEMVFNRPFKFKHRARRWPRIDFHIQMCEDLDNYDTCTETPTAAG